MSDENKIVIPAADEVDRYGGETSAAPEPPTKSEAEEWKDKFLRAKADLSNYQKRAEKDRADSLRYAVADLARALLPVIDDLDRVIANAPEDDKLLAGVKLTRDNFLKILEEFQIVPISSEGQPFDPRLHEAVLEQPSEHAERTVLKEVGRGYRLHDRVLRPARVVVSKPAGDGG